MKKIYTKTGDGGITRAIGGGQLPKDDVRVEAYGSIDELNSFIGLAVSCLENERDADIKADLFEIQQHLFACCSDTATRDTGVREYQIHEDLLPNLEQLIDRYSQEAKEIEHFIIPGGTQAASALHVCRTVTRRAERRVITLEHQEEVMNPVVKKYLNRLSDLFFVLARACNARANVQDVQYTQGKKVFR